VSPEKKANSKFLLAPSRKLVRPNKKSFIIKKCHLQLPGEREEEEKIRFWLLTIFIALRGKKFYARSLSHMVRAE
jgi:hypothetical protein